MRRNFTRLSYGEGRIESKQKVIQTPFSVFTPLVKITFALTARVIHINDFQFGVEIERG